MKSGYVGLVCAVAMTLAWPGVSRANDSVASMAVGGLELLRTDAIEMRSEDLYISPTQVRVRYVFRNATKTPVQTLVAFPLPPVGFGFEFDWVPLPFPESENYVGFATRIDGVDIPLGVESRAMLLGLDRTQMLIDLGVPLLPFDEDALARIAALPVQTRDALRAAHLITSEGAPLWTLHTAFWREQTFPPGVDVVVEHSYTPVRGGSAGAPLGNSDPDAEADPWFAGWVAEHRRRYCVEPPVEADLMAQRLAGAAPEDRHYNSSDVGYVLVTGGNWRGPIGAFRLVVETPDPRDAVFLCLEGAQRVALNRIEADLSDFWPTHDLAALFVHLHGEGIHRED